MKKRLDRGSEILFGSRHSGGIVTEYRKLHDDKNSDQDLRRWSAGALLEAMTKMLGPIAKELRTEKMTLKSSVDRELRERR